MNTFDINKRKIVIGITGASGSVYAARLLQRLHSTTIPTENIAVVFTQQGKEVFTYEMGIDALNAISFKIYPNDSYMAPFASGSSSFDTLLIAPCSMGTLGRIAGGLASDLISRTADVMLKERRRLLILVRETPLNLIQLRNMTALTEAGGIICPACPSFYSRPQNMEELVDTVVERLMHLADIPTKSFEWGQ